MVKGAGDPFLLHGKTEATARPRPPSPKRAPRPAKRPAGTFRDPNMLDLVHSASRTKD